jgi:putative ABC transport system permease protein
MFKNYLLTAIRNLLKQKGYSAINVAGLAIGMSCCLLILMFVWDELNYDRFHDKSERIYRLYLDARINDKDMLTAVTCAPLAATLRQELPGVEAAARIRHVGNFTVRYDDKTFNQQLAYIQSKELGFDKEQVLVVEFIPTLSIALKDGRNFSAEFRTDSTHAVLINEAAAKMLGYQNPVGRKVTAFFGQRETRAMEIIGLMRDFHFESLHQPIRPLALRVVQDSPTYLLLRVQGNIPEIIQEVERQWASFTGGQPFVYFFLDEELNARYAAEQTVGKVFATFSSLGIFIACLGLLGLAMYATEQRTKEVGIRKVLGANVPSIVSLLSREFVKLVLIANLVAWPVAYFAMQRWLENFAYRIALGLDAFILAAALAVAIAILTVSYQAIKAALANPVEALRYE